MKTLVDLGERALIERIRARAGGAPSWVALGIGDDAAALEPPRNAYDVVTTDSLIEGVHFRRDWSSWRDIGHKALAVNLSDLAAMGAAPRALLLSLALPQDLAVDDFDQLIEGFLELAAVHRAPLVGGNLTRSPGPVMISVVAMGDARRRRLMTRGGARPGDVLFVTGHVGGAAAGLSMLESSASRASLGPDEAGCIVRYSRPEPRLRCGTIVGRSRAATACIDLSDGLAEGARQLAEASGTGVELAASAIPVHPGAAAWAARFHQDSVGTAVAGGEDYELLFAVRPRQQRRFLSAVRHEKSLVVTRVGQLTKDRGAWIDRDGNRTPLDRGFSHFTEK